MKAWQRPAAVRVRSTLQHGAPPQPPLLQRRCGPVAAAAPQLGRPMWCRSRAPRILAAAPGPPKQRRRAVMIKTRIPTRRLKLKTSFDQPRRVVVRPDDPTFPGRIATELNSCWGPRQVAAIIDDFAPHLTASHLATAISLLAGMAGARQPPPAELAGSYQAPAARCGRLMSARLGEATPVDMARAAYGLARLKVEDAELMAQLAEATQGRLDAFPPEALAGLVAGLAAGGPPLPAEWLRRFSVASFAVMGSMDAQDLSNCVYALAQVGAPPSAVWTERALQLFRGCWGRPRCNAPSLVKFGAGLARLRLRPGFNWMAAYLRECRQQVDRLAPAEMATLLWVVVQLRHAPDPIFLDSWAKSAAARLSAFSAASLCLSVHALGALAAAGRLPAAPGGGVPGRFVNGVLVASMQIMGQMMGEQLSQLLWGLASMRVRPGPEWMAAWWQASEPKLAGAPGPALADAMWALGRMQHAPPGSWAAAAEAAVDARLPELDAQALAIIVWAATRTGSRPKREWLVAFRTRAVDQFGPEAAGQLSRLIALAVAGQLQQGSRSGTEQQGAASSRQAQGDR